MFGIYLHETNVKTSRLINTFGNKLEALGFMEETVEDFITKKDGEERGKDSLIQEPSSYKSTRWGSLPYGFFKTRNATESLYRITVWNKIKTVGYIYNSYEIRKVFSIDLIHLPLNLINSEITQVKALEAIFGEDIFDSSEIDDDEMYKKEHVDIMVNEVLPLLRHSAGEAPNITETSLTVTSRSEIDKLLDSISSRGVREMARSAIPQAKQPLECSKESSSLEDEKPLSKTNSMPELLQEPLENPHSLDSGVTFPRELNSSQS